MKLFISYARMDVGRVTQLVDILRDAGHDPWFDHRLLPGQDWKQELYRAIEACEGFVYMLTPDSVESEWCQWEFAEAVKLGKAIVPILLHKKVRLPEPIQRFQYADFSEGMTPKNVAQLIGGLSLIMMQRPLVVPDAPENPKGVPAQAESGQTPYGPLGLPLLQQLPKVAVYAPGVPAQAEPGQPPDVAAILPAPFAWCEIPAGKVTLSYVRGVTTTPAPVQEVGPFWIGKYPITEGQFERFVDAADGYRDARWWAFSDEAAAWHKAHREPAWSSPIEEYDLARMPRRTLNAYEVQAFCRWLMAQTGADGWEIRVPAAEEWHRAVQGDSEAVDVSSLRVSRDQSVVAEAETVSPFGVMHLDSSNEWWVRDLSYGPVDKKPRPGPGLSFIRSSILPSLYQFRLVAVPQDDAG